MALRGDELIVLLVALGGLGALVLTFATWLAARARKPAANKPPRKTFEHGLSRSPAEPCLSSTLVGAWMSP